jgi:hypothetical protein
MQPKFLMIKMIDFIQHIFVYFFKGNEFLKCIHTLLSMKNK